MKVCLNHPDREVPPKAKYCGECSKKKHSESVMRDAIKNRETRDDINLMNLLSDAKKNGWTMENLRRRYQSYSKKYICKILRENNIEPKFTSRKPVIKKEQRGENRIEIPDLLEETATIRLNHEHYAYIY